MKSRSLAVVFAAFAAFAAVALAAAPASAASHSVSADDNNGAPPYRFMPATITIAPGDSVTWTNTGQAPHTATGSGFDFAISKGGHRT